MNESELIRQVAKNTGRRVSEVKVVMDTCWEAIAAALAAGESVTVTGMGTFEVHTRQPKRGRDLQTGGVLPLPARRVPFFRVSRRLRDRVSKENSESEL